MAETKKETGGQEPSAKTADAKQELAVQDTSTKPVVDLLTGILTDVQKQVQSETPEPLEGVALQAMDQFRDIVAALALTPKPGITLTAVPDQFSGAGGETTLTWTSTGAHRVSITAQEQGSSIVRDLGVVTPTAGGSIKVIVPPVAGGVSKKTTFKATADPCGSTFAEAIVTLSP